MKDITIVCADTKNRQEAKDVIERMTEIFPCKRSLFFTNDVSSDKVEVINIPDIETRSQYSLFILKDLPQYIDTNHVLIVQHDGYILNPSKWKEEFLQYDYIGAPWTIRQTMFKHQAPDESYCVGNGGFSLRSKKFLEISFNIFKDAQPRTMFCEDISCCIYYRKMFLENNINFSPIDLAFKFSIEDVLPQYFKQDSPYQFEHPFGFHKHIDKINILTE